MNMSCVTEVRSWCPVRSGGGAVPPAGSAAESREPTVGLAPGSGPDAPRLIQSFRGPDIARKEPHRDAWDLPGGPAGWGQSAGPASSRAIGPRPLATLSPVPSGVRVRGVKGSRGLWYRKRKQCSPLRTFVGEEQARALVAGRRRWSGAGMVASGRDWGRAVLSRGCEEWRVPRPHPAPSEPDLGAEPGTRQAAESGSRSHGRWETQR